MLILAGCSRPVIKPTSTLEDTPRPTVDATREAKETALLPIPEDTPEPQQAKYGADNCGADWYEQAAKSAKSYLDYSSFSRKALIDQLKYEGFTHEQAIYGVEANGY